MFYWTYREIHKILKTKNNVPYIVSKEKYLHEDKSSQGDYKKLFQYFWPHLFSTALEVQILRKKEN